MQPIRTESLEWAALPHINPHAAGLDISATEIVACVRPDMSDTPIRTFSTYTPDLEALADWLQACHVTTVAMEATGVYWIPVYEILVAIAGSMCTWSTPGTSRMCRGARRISAMANGCKPCTPTAC